MLFFLHATILKTMLEWQNHFIDAGIPIFIDKPLAINLNDLDLFFRSE